MCITALLLLYMHTQSEYISGRFLCYITFQNIIQYDSQVASLVYHMTSEIKLIKNKTTKKKTDQQEKSKKQSTSKDKPATWVVTSRQVQMLASCCLLSINCHHHRLLNDTRSKHLSSAQLTW